MSTLIVDQAQTGGIMVSWLLILIAVGMLLGGAVLVVIGLSNRHTRGATKYLLGAGGLVAFLAVASVIGMRMSSTNRAVADRQPAGAISDEQRATAEYYLELADRMQEGQGLAPARAEEYRQLAADVLAQEHGYAGHAQHSTRSSIAIGLLSPFALLAFAAVVFVAFKHGGPGIGLAALALPLIVIGYASFEGSSSYEVSQGIAHPNKAELIRSAEKLADSIPDVPIPPYVPEAPAVVKVVVDSEATTPALHTDQSLAVVEVQSPAEDEAENADVEVEKTSSVDELQPALPPVETPATADGDIPDWVREPPKSVENVYRRVVESGWYANSDTCQQQIKDELYGAVMAYMQELATEESRRGAYVPPLESLGISQRFIREQIVADEYYQSRDFEHQDGMKNLHVLLEFNNTVTQKLQERWRAYARQESIRVVAVMMGGVLATLTGLLGLIKLDTYTKGFYTKRLFIGVPAAIIGGGLLLAMLS